MRRLGQSLLRLSGGKRRNRVPNLSIARPDEPKLSEDCVPVPPPNAWTDPIHHELIEEVDFLEGESFDWRDLNPLVVEASSLDDRAAEDSLEFLDDSKGVELTSDEGTLRLPHIAGFRILEEIGRGGMGVAYKAIELGLNRLVAVKMILTGPHAGPDATQRFVAEAESLAKLSHPNIVQVFTTGSSDGLRFVVLEYVDGGSLADHLDGTPWHPRDAAEFILVLARAMHQVHLLGIVHRDLKPANILLTTEGTPKISDFGLAKSLSDDTRFTRTDWIVGSPSYMAPEQTRGGKRQIGPATDVYALGANLYELLTGRPPFRGQTALDTLEQVRNIEPIPPARLVPGLPRDLETICLKCLQKDAGRRYSTAEELANDLECFLENRPIRGRRTPGWERLWMWAKRCPDAAALIVVTCVGASSLTIGGISYHRYAENRRAERELHLAGLRRQLEETIALGREAYRAGDWAEATSRYGRAGGLARTDLALAEFLDPIERALDECRRRMAEQERSDRLRRQRETFLRLHDEAVFYQSQYTGLDLDSSLKSTRRAARQALELIGDSSELSHAPLLEPIGSNESQSARIRQEGYELVLILAGAEAQSLPSENPTRQAQVALDVLDTYRSLHPPTRAYHLQRAQVLEKLRRKGESQTERELAGKAVGGEMSAVDQFLLGEERFRNHEWESALRHFQHVLSLEPEHFWAAYLLAICHLKLQQPTAAQAVLIGCQAQRPDFVWIYLLKGFAEGELGEFELAEGDFKRAFELGLDDDARYVLLVNRGVMRIRRGDLHSAIDDLQAAMRLRPDHFQAPLNLAQSFMQSGRNREALCLLNTALQHHPAQPLLLRLRSQIRDRLGDTQGALEDLDAVLRTLGPNDPQRIDDLIQSGRIQHRLKNYDAALAAYEAAIRREPGNATARQLRGLALMERSRYDEAIQEFDQCIQNGSSSGLLYEARGLAQAWRGHHAEAVADFTLALRFSRDPVGVRMHRGWSYLALGAPKLAETDFKSVQENGGDTSEACLGQALAALQLHRPSDALRLTRAAIRAKPLGSRLAYNAARVYAQLSRCDLAEFSPLQCRNEALKLLREAVERLPLAERPRFWHEVVTLDSALLGLRSSPEFQAIERSTEWISSESTTARFQQGTQP